MGRLGQRILNRGDGVEWVRIGLAAETGLLRCEKSSSFGAELDYRPPAVFRPDVGIGRSVVPETGWPSGICLVETPY